MAVTKKAAPTKHLTDKDEKFYSNKTAERPSNFSMQTRRASTLLKHASDPTRLQILLLLDDVEINVTALCLELSQGQPAVSHHLALLRNGGLIAPRRDGTSNYYSLTDAGRMLAAALGNLMREDRSSNSRDASRLEKEISRLEREVGTVMDDPRGWMNRPNVQFDGRKPIDLIGTEEQGKLTNMIKAAQQGMFS